MKTNYNGLVIEAIIVNLQLFAGATEGVVVPSNARVNMMTTASSELGGVDGAFQKANDAKFVEIHKEALVFDKYLGSTSIPAHSGSTARFPKKVRIKPKNTKLAEGLTPDPSKISLQFVTGQIEQHGDYVLFTDVAMGTSIYDLMGVAREAQAYQSAEIKNALIRDDILGETDIPVFYPAENVTAPLLLSHINAMHRLSVALVRKVVTAMKRNNIRPAVGGDYVMFIHPDQAHDLMSDSEWKQMHQYVDNTPLLDGEVGRISGCRFVETTTVLVTHDGAAITGMTGVANTSTGVYHSIMMGADAVDQIKLDGGGIKTIGKGLGSGGTADPLDQRATVGWKMFYGCKVKDPLAVTEVMTTSFNSGNIPATDINTQDW